MKTRIIAHQQQVVRLDRDSVGDIGKKATSHLLRLLERSIQSADAVVVGDYGKGVVTQTLLNSLKEICRAHGVWLSVDPKPAHILDLSGVSLLTPNRKEAFELAGVSDTSRCANPLKDEQLMMVAERLLGSILPTILLITLGEHGMLLCENGKQPVHIPTVAQQVFDVSGAGDTVIATLTAAIAAGGSPVEAAILANYAAGVVVGKVGTATTTPQELLKSVPTSNFQLEPRFPGGLAQRTDARPLTTMRIRTERVFQSKHRADDQSDTVIPRQSPQGPTTNRNRRYLSAAFHLSCKLSTPPCVNGRMRKRRASHQHSRFSNIFVLSEG